MLTVSLISAAQPASDRTAPHQQSSEVVATAEFVGRQVCSGCHQQQDQLWQGSHHDWAMKPADEQSVLGDFNDATFEHFGEKTRMFKQDGKFWVTTDNAQGEQQTFPVLYTFGFYPLQQYLLPMGDGRMQALGVAWDSRPAAEGGQRWFHLYPDEAIPHSDILHWTGPYQTWNSRCADCHSTNLQRNFQAQTNTYATSWSEINVSCEACHGPGSQHVSLMQSPGAPRTSEGAAGAGGQHQGFDRSLDPVGQWLQSDQSPTAKNPQAQQLVAKTEHDQISVCGSCHARRSTMDNQNLPGDFHQKHRLQLVQEPLYYGDGQIRDEVYVLGSFMQSKMHEQGVVCSNCHEPHSLKLRAEGNGVCAQCHRPDVFDRPEHHHHPVGSSGAQCANCHMPETTYMVVDPRRDHSLRIPRPDLSVAYGTPNACNQCHQDQTASWASSAVDEWLKVSGKTRKWHFSDDLLPALRGAPDATTRLMKLAMARHIPALIQASALAGLETRLTPQTILLAQTQLNHRNAMVRAAAVNLLSGLPARQRWEDFRPLLQDSSKQVRMAVARHTVDVSANEMTAADKARWENLQQEYQAALLLDQDTADGQMAIGIYRLLTGDQAAAQAAYRKALAYNPSLVGAYLNLADLYRQQQDEDRADAVLRTGLQKQPTAAALHHSLGLSLIRRQDYAAAQRSLAQAAKLDPGNARYGYVNGLMLQRDQQPRAAVKEWQRVLQQHPQDRDVLTALLQQSQQAGDGAQMLEYAERLLAVTPDSRQLQQMVDQLRQHFGGDQSQ
nr:multiheme c-type cytochrome [Aestuariicella hydrocarbonica]